MFFLIFGDIVAVWLYPIFIGVASVLCPLAYAHSGLFDLSSRYCLPDSIYVFIGVGVWFILMNIGSLSPNYREIPEDLRSYLVGCTSLVLKIELATIAIHCGATICLRLLQIEGSMLLGLGSVALGWLVLYHTLNRTYLWQPPTTLRSHTIRGQELSSSREIEMRAWQDD